MSSASSSLRTSLTKLPPGKWSSPMVQRHSLVHSSASCDSYSWCFSPVGIGTSSSSCSGELPCSARRDPLPRSERAEGRQLNARDDGLVAVILIVEIAAGVHFHG